MKESEGFELIVPLRFDLKLLVNQQEGFFFTGC